MKLAQFKVLAPKLDAELRALFEKHGIEVKHREGLVDETTGEIKMTLKLWDRNHGTKPGETATPPEAIRFREYAQFYDLDPLWLDKSFRFRRDVYTIKGLREGRAAGNVIVLRQDGKRFRMKSEDVATYMRTQGV